MERKEVMRVWLERVVVRARAGGAIGGETMSGGNGSSGTECGGSMRGARI